MLRLLLSLLVAFVGAGQIVIRNSDDSDNAPRITTTSITNATEDEACSVTIATQAGVGKAPLVFSVSSGTLPTGASLNTSSGAITGTCSAAGTFTFTIRVVDALSGTHEQKLSWTIEAASGDQSTACADAATGGTARYMDSAATGTGTGASWANAWTTLSEAESEVTRGQVVCVADGSYGGATFNLAASGTTTVTFKKATVADHGSATGWSDAMGNGQAVFGELNLQTDYWVFNGATRTDANWNDETTYGLKATALDANGAGGANSVQCTQHLTVSYMAISTGCLEASCRPMHVAPTLGSGETCASWLISRSLFYQSTEIQMNATDSVTFEYTYFRNLYGKEAIRAHGGHATNTVIRHSVFHNSCRDDNNPGGGCTAVLGFFGDPGPDDYDGFRFYGNVIRKTISQHQTDAAVMVQSADCVIVNNTIVDDSDSGVSSLLCGEDVGGGGTVQNNVLYLPNGMTAGFQGGTANNNSTYTSSPPFVNTATGDVHLTGALAGASLASTYNTDLDGVTRGADGTWDRGAFEFEAPLPAAWLVSPALWHRAAEAFLVAQFLPAVVGGDHLARLAGIAVDPHHGKEQPDFRRGQPRRFLRRQGAIERIQRW